MSGFSVRAFLFIVCALPLLAAACKKDAQKGVVEKAAIVSDVGTVAFSGDVLAFGGIKSLDEFTSAMTGLVSKFEPQMGAMIGAQVPALLQGQVLGVKNMGWLDNTRPVRFVVLDYKKYADPLLLAMPLKSKEALNAALPDDKSEGAPGNDMKYPLVMGGEKFVNFVGDMAVFSGDAATFAKARSFIEGDFKDYQFTELLDVQVSSTQFRKVAGEDIAAFQESMTNLPPTQSGLELPGIQEMLKKEVQMMIDILEQTETARMAIRYDGTDLEILGSVKVVADKGLATFVKATADRKPSLYRSLPQDGWFMMAANMDPRLFLDWANLGVGFWSKMLKMDESEEQKLTILMNDILVLETGDFAFYLGYDGDFPFHFLSVTGLKDAAKAKALMYEMYGILFARAGTLLDSMAGPEFTELPDLDWASPKTLIASLKPELDKAGVTASIHSENVSGVAVDSLEVGIDYTKIPLPAGDEGLKKLTGAIGNKFSGALGFGNNLMYGSFGKDAVTDISGIMKGGSKGLLDEIVAGSKTRIAMFGYLGLRDLLKVVAQIDPDLGEDLPGLAMIKDPVGMSFVIGGRDERILEGSMKMPISQIAKLVPKRGQAAPAPTP